jgi:DNA-binding phage protein
MNTTWELVERRIKAAMADRGETRISLAKKAQMDRHALARRIDDPAQFKLSEVDRVAKALGLRVSELVDEEAA